MYNTFQIFSTFTCGELYATLQLVHVMSPIERAAGDDLRLTVVNSWAVVVIQRAAVLVSISATILLVQC